MANNIFSGIGSRSPIDGESRMASSVMESISKLPSFTADTEIQRFQTGGMAFHFPAGSSYGESGMSGLPPLTSYIPETLNEMFGNPYSGYFDEESYDYDPALLKLLGINPPTPPFWDRWGYGGPDIYGTPTPGWYDPNSTWTYSPTETAPQVEIPPVETPPVEQPPTTTGTIETEPTMEEIVATGQQPSWWQNWFPWMAGLGAMAGLGGIGGGASATGAATATEPTTAGEPTTVGEGTTTAPGEPTTVGTTEAGGVLSGIGPPGLGIIPVVAGAVATEEENGGDPYIPQAQPYVPPMGSLIPSQVTSENPFVYSPLNVGDYSSISGYLDPRTMGGDPLGYTPYLGSGIGGLLPQSEYVPGVSDMWNDNWASTMEYDPGYPSWRPSMPWELSNMPADLYTQPPPPPPDETPPPDDTTPVTPVIPPDVPINIPPIIPGVGPNLPFDPETYDWSGIMNQYQPQIPTMPEMPDLSQYALKTDLPTIPEMPTMPELPSATQFNPETYDWSGIMSQYQPTMPEMPDLSPYALKADMPTTPTMPGQFDPTSYNWGNIFNQYQQDMPTFEQFDPTGLQSQISSLQGQQQFDPTGYNWGDVFQQYQQDMPTFEQFDPTSLQGQISALQGQQQFDPMGYDWGGVFNQYQQEMPAFEQFDPTNYDWGGVFNQYQQEMPEIPSYNAFNPTGYDWQNVFNQYQQDMPSFAMPDLSGYLTQGDLASGLGSLPNYNAEIRALSDRMNALNSRFDNYQPPQNYSQPGLGLFT